MLQGKVVLITGGAQGIGRYIAHTFAQEGANVAIGDILPTDNICNELRGMEVDTIGIKADVTNEKDVESMVDQVMKKFGRIDVLVNDAAIVPHFAWGGPRWPAIKDMDKSFWDKVMGTNLGGTFLCTKHVVRRMTPDQGGHVLNLYGGGSGTGAAPYVVSKEAIKVFTRFVAEEERENNICIVALSPGGTIATENAPEEARQRLPGPDLAGKRFVLAAEVGMDVSGRLLDLKDDKLVVSD
jgi:NAD(P)-dependent dehydrogenase (short-subunit alcohol dehydrogenase family)